MNITERILVIMELVTKGYVTPIDKVNKKHKALNKTIAKTNNIMKGLKMNMLGAGFAGMALVSAMRGLLNPVTDAYGVMDLWSQTLLVVFLPAMEAIYPFLLSFMNFMMNLPEPVKKVIGALTVMVLIFGTLLSVGSFVMLGLVSAIGLLGAPIIIAIAAVAALVAAFIFFKPVRDLINTWVIEPIKNILFILKLVYIGILQTLGYIVDAFVWMWGKVKEVFAPVSAFFKKIWDGLGTGLKGAANGIIAVFNGIIGGVETLLNGAINSIQKLIDAANKIPKVNIPSIKFRFDIPRIPSFQTGGLVPETGLAMVHKGEYITRRDQMNGSGNDTPIQIIYNISGNGNTEIKRLIQDANTSLVRDLQRLVRS